MRLVETRWLVVAGLLATTAVLPSGSNPSRAAGQLPVNASDERVQTTAGPEVERTTDTWAIIRWTSTKLRGTSLRYGMVHYGTDPHALNQTAKSPNRRNPALPLMIFRVQVNHLQPETTYYYRVESVDALNIAEGSESPVNQFTTERSP
jgi:phosphodiesterase/alkaline phosphatase D-like protein